MPLGHRLQLLNEAVKSFNATANTVATLMQQLKAAAVESVELEAHWRRMQEREEQLQRDVMELGFKMHEIRALVEFMFLKFAHLEIRGRFVRLCGGNADRTAGIKAMRDRPLELDDLLPEKERQLEEVSVRAVKRNPACATWFQRLELFAAGLLRLACQAEDILATSKERALHLEEMTLDIRLEEVSVTPSLAYFA